jgi:hypothetical protein
MNLSARFNLKMLAVGMMAFVLLAGIAQATPSTTYWTPMTPDIQPYGVVHVGIDNYFRVATKPSDETTASFPTDLGLTVGVLPLDKIQMEIGVDYMAPSDNPWFFNAKIGAPEGALFNWSPALQIGIFNVGTKTNDANLVNGTNQNIFYGVISKSIPYIGRLSVGPYVGNSSVLRSSAGEKENTGYMVALDHGFLPVKDKDGNEYNKIVLAADYASGKNAIGGGGFGLYYFFTKDISLLTGPVWFNDEGINGKWKWTTQLDINLDVLSNLFKK